MNKKESFHRLVWPDTLMAWLIWKLPSPRMWQMPSLNVTMRLDLFN